MFDDPVTQGQLIEAIKLILMLLLGSIVSPVVMRVLTRRKDEAAVRKMVADAIVTEADGAGKIANLSADMVKTMYERVLQLTERVTKVETEKELIREESEKEKADLRNAYEKVMAELSERRVVEARMQTQITLLTEENARLHELIKQLQSQNGNSCRYVDKNCPFESPREVSPVHG